MGELSYRAKDHNLHPPASSCSLIFSVARVINLRLLKRKEQLLPGKGWILVLLFYRCSLVLPAVCVESSFLTAEQRVLRVLSTAFGSRMLILVAACFLSSCCRLLPGSGKFCFPHPGTPGLKDGFSVSFPLSPGLKFPVSPCHKLRRLQKQGLKGKRALQDPATVTGTRVLFIKSKA